MPDLYLVTGATGAIGRAVVRELVSQGKPVRAMVRDEGKFRRLRLGGDVDLVVGDALLLAAVKAAAEGTTALIHCVNVPLTAYEQTLEAAGNVVEVARLRGIHLVYPGNTWVFGPPPALPITAETPRNPPTEIARIKNQAIEMVLDGGGSIVYLPEIFGPGVDDDLFRPLFEAALAGKNSTFPGPVDFPHEFIYIDDAARALIAVTGQPAARGRSYTVPGPGIITARQFGQMIYQVAGTNGEMRQLSSRILRPASWFDIRVRAGIQVLHVFDYDVHMDGSQIKAEFGFEPGVSYEEGIRRTLTWYRERTS